MSEAKPAQKDTAYEDDRYFEGPIRRRLAITGPNISTEVDYAKSGEGSSFVREFETLPGSSTAYPYSVETFHRLEQASIRMVWQFGENSWVHPYVSGGVVGDRERQRRHIPEVCQCVSSGGISRPVLVVPEVNSGPTWEYRLGVTAGAGAKVYPLQSTFLNTGFISSWSAAGGHGQLFWRR